LINEEGSAAGLDRVGDAVAGGHLRFVSLHDAEASALVAAGASGALDEPASDFVLSSVQNLGADKLDFHAARKIEHSCDLTDERGPLCATKVTISNEAPQGLPRYVTPNEPYGVMKSFAEIYIPGRAEVSGVFQGEKSVDYFEGTQDGLRAVGVKMQILPGEQEDLSVVYRMPPGEAYALVVVPQPLSHDADLSVTLDLGADQTVRGPGELKEGVLTYEGALTGTTNFVVEPDRRAGLSKAWQKVVRFWNEPIS
jgi:hypothetical protein